MTTIIEAKVANDDKKGSLTEDNSRPALAEAPVLVVGAGPIGLVTAYQLARRGIRTVLVERNHETTRWPKMDITNARSMELLARLGLAEKLRKQGGRSRLSTLARCF